MAISLEPRAAGTSVGAARGASDPRFGRAQPAINTANEKRSAFAWRVGPTRRFCMVGRHGGAIPGRPERHGQSEPDPTFVGCAAHQANDMRESVTAIGRRACGGWLGHATRRAMADVRSDPGVATQAATKAKRRVAAIDGRLWKLLQRSGLFRHTQDTERARLLRRIVRRLAERALAGSDLGCARRAVRSSAPSPGHQVHVGARVE